MRRPLVIAVIALIAGSSCSLFDRGDETLSEMTLERRGPDGVVRVVHEGETFEVEDRRRVEPGDVISTSGGAQARLRLEGDREIWLATSTIVEVIDTDAVGDERGTVLADADDPTSVMFGDIEASTSRGVFRIDRMSASASAGVYAGTVDLDAPGEERERVHTYYQAAVAAGEIQSVAPYQIDGADEWDRLWLEDVVALDEELRQLADGFSSQIRGARPRLSYFQGFARGENVGVVESYLRRKPADLLIAFTIANTDRARPFGRSFARAFTLHDDGAAWGLAVAIMDVRSAGMVAALERLIVGTGALAGGGDGDFGSIASGADDTTGPGGGTDGDSSGPPSTDGDSDTSDPSGDGDGGGGGGSTDGDGGGDCENVIDCTLQDPPVPLPEVSPGEVVEDLLP
jgi:hypothetical protein